MGLALERTEEKPSLTSLFAADAVFVDTNQLNLSFFTKNGSFQNDVIKNVLKTPALAEKIPAGAFTSLCQEYFTAFSSAFADDRIFLGPNQKDEIYAYLDIVRTYALASKKFAPAFREAADLHVGLALLLLRSRASYHTTGSRERLYTLSAWADTVRGDAVPWNDSAMPLSKVDAGIISCALEVAASPIRPLVHVLSADRSVRFVFENAAYVSERVFEPGSHLAHGIVPNYLRTVSLEK